MPCSIRGSRRRAPLGRFQVLRLRDAGRARFRSAIVAATVLTLAAASTVTAAAAPPVGVDVGCGAVLTKDTTLTADLLECPGDGLVIGADGITVDLADHRVQGSILFGDDPDQVGISNRAGHDRVTIRNGTVEDFGGGVLSVGGNDVRIIGLQVGFASDYGVRLAGAGSRVVVSDNTVSNTNGYGIVVIGSTGRATRNIVIAGNTVESTLIAGIAVQHGSITRTRIVDNEVSRTSASEGWSAAIVVGRQSGTTSHSVVRANRLHDNYGAGISLGRAADHTVVTDNHLTDNSSAAVEVAGDDTTVTRNLVDTASVSITDVGVLLDPTARRSVVTANDIRGAQLAGVADIGRATRIAGNRIDGFQPGADWWGGGFGGVAVFEEANGSQVAGNTILRQYERGISVEGSRVTVIGNRVSQTRYGDGIHVEASSRRVRLLGNQASAAADDGIEVVSPSTSLAENVATGNTDLGIVVVAGVSDGGGNRASGNGNPAQCQGLVCDITG